MNPFLALMTFLGIHNNQALIFIFIISWWLPTWFLVGFFGFLQRRFPACSRRVRALERARAAEAKKKTSKEEGELTGAEKGRASFDGATEAEGEEGGGEGGRV